MFMLGLKGVNSIFIGISNLLLLLLRIDKEFCCAAVAAVEDHLCIKSMYYLTMLEPSAVNIP
jgi:hypothetical protein